jgi:hypothetical protein
METNFEQFQAEVRGCFDLLHIEGAIKQIPSQDEVPPAISTFSSSTIPASELSPIRVHDIM